MVSSAVRCTSAGADSFSKSLRAMKWPSNALGTYRDLRVEALGKVPVCLLAIL